MYKLIEGMDEEQEAKFHVDLERAARKIQHPLYMTDVEPPTFVQKDNASEPKKRERTPPPGWKSEKEAFNNAMALMNFNGKVGKRR